MRRIYCDGCGIELLDGGALPISSTAAIVNYVVDAGAELCVDCRQKAQTLNEKATKAIGDVVANIREEWIAGCCGHK